MLFKSADVDGIRRGEITLAFRRWKRPTVKVGGTLRVPDRVLAIAAVDALRENTDLSDAEMSALLSKLTRFDRETAWTRRVLKAIDKAPGKRAADLAAKLGYETLWFKAHVRKLKALGLTESLEVGYRLSPRGRRVLDTTE